MTAHVWAVSVVSLPVPTADASTPRKFFERVTQLTKTLMGHGNPAARVWHFAVGGDPQFLRRRDFTRLLAAEKPPSEQLACCLGMLQGFRTSEILHARYEHVEPEEGTLWVRDAKKHRLYPLGLRRETAYAYDRCPRDTRTGLILKHHPRFRQYRGRPLSKMTLNQMVKRWAYEAGLRNWRQWKVQWLRQFFAKDWARRGGDVVLLSKAMRHVHPFTTWMYLQRIVFLEDVDAEMRRLYDRKGADTHRMEVDT